MIKTDCEYRITKAQVHRFEAELARLLAADTPGEGLDPLLLDVQRVAVRSQLADLQAEVDEYDALRSGQQVVPDLSMFVELPKLLIQQRIAAGLSQRELAERLGIKEQQIQRYEATDYAAASFTRLGEIIKSLSIVKPGSAATRSDDPDT